MSRMSARAINLAGELAFLLAEEGIDAATILTANGSSPIHRLTLKLELQNEDRSDQ